VKNWISEAGSETPVESGTTTLRAFDRLLDGHLGYCVLHGWQSRPRYPPSDLDIAIAPGDLEKLERILASTTDVRITQLIQHEATCYYFVLVSTREGRVCFSTLDAAVDYRSDGRIFFAASDLLRHSRKDNGFRVAAPEVEFAYLLVKKISKGTLPEHQKTRVRSLFELLGNNAHVTLHRLLGTRCGNQVIDWLARSDWAALEARLAPLKRALRFEVIKRDPFNPIRYWGPEVYRQWRRWRQPTGLLVALLGPDGAGKSTLIEHLEKNLGEGGFRRAAVFHLRARRRHRSASHNPVTDPHRNAPYPPWLSLLKISYYAMAYLIGYMCVVRPRLVRSTLVLFDRYYDDLLVDPRRYRYGASMRFARLARYFVRRPDLYFVLDVAEEQLAHRKQEVPREELGRQRKAYLRLALELPNAVVLDGSLPAGEVARSANDAIVDYLHERYVNRRRQWFGRDTSEETLRWLTSILCSSPDKARFDFRGRLRNTLAAPRWATVKTFGWLSLGDGRAYLIPLEATRVGRRALDLYNTQSLKAGFAKTLFATGLRLGVAKRLMPTVDLIARGTLTGRHGSDAHILDYLKTVLRREDLTIGISVGTPGRHRKPVLLVLGGDGRSLAYVKIGSSDDSSALVQREAEALQFLADHPCRSFSTPTVLHSGWWNGRYLVAQSAPKQDMKPVAADLRFRCLDIPTELAALHTRWMSLKEIGFWEDILQRIHKIPNRYYRETLERAVRKAEARLRAERLPLHLSHGDFAPWNTRNGGEKFYVFDWEHSRETGLPAQDLFHFHFQEMRCVERRDIEKIYVAFSRDSTIRTRIETHLAGLGLTGVPVEFLFFLYRLDQLANEAAEVRAGVPTFREFAMFGKLLNAV
jgi:thymidylate kinase